MARPRPGDAPPPPVPRLLAISDRRSGTDPDLATWLQDLARAWTAHAGEAPRLAVQVREKDLDDASLLDLLRRARACLPPAIPVLVNGRVDLALAAGIDGVHLPSRGLPTAEARRATAAAGRRLLVGRSTHSAEEVAAARRDGADYATFGPVFPTPSKAAYGPPPGLSGLTSAAATGLPILALGGITADRLGEVAAAGAHGAAAIRAFHDEAATSTLLAAADRAFPRHDG